MNARVRTAEKAKPYLFVLFALVLVEIVASTIFATGVFVLIALGDGIPVEPFLGLLEMIVGVNRMVLVVEVLTYSLTDLVLIGATLVAYVIAAVLVAIAARAADRRYDLVDDDFGFGVILP